jgi:hypothetical protein
VCIVDTDTDAHATFVAMSKVFSATDTTKATVVAMKWFFVKLHPQVTRTAMILSKRNSTLNALVAATREGRWGRMRIIEVRMHARPQPRTMIITHVADD